MQGIWKSSGIRVCAFRLGYDRPLDWFKDLMNNNNASFKIKNDIYEIKIFNDVYLSDSPYIVFCENQFYIVNAILFYKLFEWVEDYYSSEEHKNYIKKHELKIGDKIKYKKDIFEIKRIMEFSYIELDRAYEKNYTCLWWQDLDNIEKVM